MERNGVQKGVRSSEEAGARKAGTGARKDGYQVRRDREARPAGHWGLEIYGEGRSHRWKEYEEGRSPQ